MSDIVLTDTEVARIQWQLEKHEWYQKEFERFRFRVDEMLRKQPQIPVRKGRAFFESCPDDNARLEFDPYEPKKHICPRCGRNWTGEKYDLAWVRQFQEWLQKRTIEAGVLFRVLGEEKYAGWVAGVLRHFTRHYEDYPLANNLLGPTRLFQSTYLEAFWLADMVIAYDLVKAASCFTAADHQAIKTLFYKSCEVIRSFDERISNRQAFNNVGMGAVGLLYEDQELIDHVLNGPSGFAFHMRTSLLEDGMWYEGENYHFATLDHLLNLAELARHRGIDLYQGTSGYGSLRPMFYGPLKAMYPNLTFPSRKDGWFGRGIEYYREIYELGYARYQDELLGGLLAHSYQQGGGRRDFTWRAFIYLEPELPAKPVEDLRPQKSQNLPGSGVAVLRREKGATYASIEYGHYGGGHGHPDRLHLSFFDQGNLWLTDPGTGWYHTPDLGWYRSTLAHNTVVVDGNSQNPAEGELTAFGSCADVQVSQAVIPEVYPGVKMSRTVCLTDIYLLDVFTVDSTEEHTYDWVFHSRATVDVPADRAGVPAQPGERNGYEFLADVRRHDIPAVDVMLMAGEARLAVKQLGASEVFTARAPGIPLQEDTPFNTVIARRQGTSVRYVTCMLRDPARGPWSLREEDGRIVLEQNGQRHFWEIADGGGVAMAAYHGGDWQKVAWFGRKGASFPGLTITGDQLVDHAAVIRDNLQYRVDLPDEFGEIIIRGLPREVEAVTGLPEGAIWKFEEDELLLRQKAGVVLWLEPEKPRFYAGCVNQVLICCGAYGHDADAPEIQLPEGWKLLSITEVSGEIPAWQAEILPSSQRVREASITVRCGEIEEFEQEFYVELLPPVETSWDVLSGDEGPAVCLHVRDLTGNGGQVRGRIYASWKEEPFPFTADLKTGAADVFMPLPLHPVSPGKLTSVPDEALAEKWRLPGLTNTAGQYELMATVQYDSFQGFTRARLPIHWTTRRGEESLLSIELNREDQAYWAEFPYAGPDDCAATADVSWNDDGLYLVCEAQDDMHVTSANEDDLYENDSIQVYFDFRRKKRRQRDFTPGVAAYILAPDDEKQTVRLQAIAGNREISNRGARAGWFTVEGVEAKVKPTADGYRIEAFFPFQSLGVDSPQPGDVIGFDLALSDNDGTWYRKLQLMWSGSRGRRCYIRGSYHNPKEFGYLVFGRGKGDVAGEG